MTSKGSCMMFTDCKSYKYHCLEVQGEGRAVQGQRPVQGLLLANLKQQVTVNLTTKAIISSKEKILIVPTFLAIILATNSEEKYFSPHSANTVRSRLIFCESSLLKFWELFRKTSSERVKLEQHTSPVEPLSSDLKGLRMLILFALQSFLDCCVVSTLDLHLWRSYYPLLRISLGSSLNLLVSSMAIM